MPGFGVQIVNTLILLLAGLPMFDLLLSPADHLDTPPKPEGKAYSYEVAKKDPTAFARWWKYYAEQSGEFYARIFCLDSTGVPRLRPNSEATLFNSRISINSKGFRGKEFPEDKGNAYRIVALGESTTFGLTMDREGRPWPEILEQMIHERLGPRQPVEVINAGIPACNLKGNIERLSPEILPLKPDLVISYHGFNGFRFIYDRLPPFRGDALPVYQPRPLKLLADFEYRMRMRNYKQRYSAKLTGNPTPVARPMETEYARMYQQLIRTTRTNGIRLGLATYSMAVNDRSDPDVIDFYRAQVPALRWHIEANRIHSTIVKLLTQENPDVCFVDTQPGLDGHHEKFIDPVHVTNDGERQLAEAFFAGIRMVLEEALTHTNSVAAER